MTEPQLLSKEDRKTIWRFTLGAATFWIALSFLPLLALKCGLFKLRTKKEVETVQSVLAQLGTYGDMFGALNCVFSGAAFIGVVYAVILQRRELHHSHEAAENSRKSSEIQNRMALYQYLAEYHRNQVEIAKDDQLLVARSKGREKAYAELISDLLRELNALAAGGLSSKALPANYHDHPARIATIYGRYQADGTDYRSTMVQFRPVITLLTDLVEEIAALTELNPGNEEARQALLQAGHAINAAVRPGDVLNPKQNDDAQFGRDFQIRKAREAFIEALHALKALGAVELLELEPVPGSQDTPS